MRSRPFRPMIAFVGSSGGSGYTFGSSGDDYFVATAAQTTFMPSWTLGSTIVIVYRNGVKQRPGSSFDYQITGGNVVFTAGLESGDTVEIIQ